MTLGCVIPASLTPMSLGDQFTQPFVISLALTSELYKSSTKLCEHHLVMSLEQTAATKAELNWKLGSQNLLLLLSSLFYTYSF